jgi:hypothetical protein
MKKLFLLTLSFCFSFKLYAEDVVQMSNKDSFQINMNEIVKDDQLIKKAQENATKTFLKLIEDFPLLEKLEECKTNINIP